MILRDQDGNQYEYELGSSVIERLDIPAAERGKHMRAMQERHVRQSNMVKIGNAVGLLILLAFGMVAVAIAWRAVRWAFGA